FGACVGIAMLILMPFELGAELLRRADLPGEVAVLWSLLYLLQGIVIAGLESTLVAGELVGRESRGGALLAAGLLRLPGLLVLAVLSLLGITLGCCAFAVGTVPAAWLLSAAPVAYVIERPHALLGITGSLRRSARLVRGWDSFGRWLAWSAVSF